MKILVTCPPMLGMKDQFLPILKAQSIDCHCPTVVQTLSEQELCELVPDFDGWIIGDDPASAAVFRAGKNGRLRAAVKWGIGIDNVDFQACRDLGISVVNTPDMFGGEVADVALGYVIALARETFLIDRKVRQGFWPKPLGISISGKTIGLVGFGDIGKSFAQRAKAVEANLIVYDPGILDLDKTVGQLEQWPQRIELCDFLVFTCSLNSKNRHMLNESILERVKNGVRIINVARGPLIDERALCEGLKNGRIYSAALDVFEEEPVSETSYLLRHERCVLGSHNASNTLDAVSKTNLIAIDRLLEMLE